MGADDNRRMSRRAWFSRVLAPLKPVAKTKPPGPNPHLEVAVIAARSCLPYQGTACTMCSDQCPVPGAIAFEENLPVIVPEICTGCRICHDVCPAPVNAILMIPRRTPPPAAEP
jgi:Na+-translocating ferredoxin:NAD+ oxidoreductase RNF subunit RnfB